MQAHTPVLLKETLDILAPKEGEKVLDVTLGLGGHSEALLQKIGKTGSLVAIDADEENIKIVKERLAAYRSQLTIIHANFSELPDCLSENERTFDCILADLGLSSPHIDDPKRGFTFRENVPLDMRFDRSKGMTAALLLASVDPLTLLKIFRDGELPRLRQLVDAIVNRRKENPVRSSNDLIEIAKSVYRHKASDYLPQIFQALRMAVNEETEVLSRFLRVAPGLLSPGGRLVIISYHSLEDRLVKTAFKSLTADTKDPITGAVSTSSKFILRIKKSMTPTEEEVKNNSRSRSARLRALERRELYTSNRT